MGGLTSAGWGLARGAMLVAVGVAMMGLGAYLSTSAGAVTGDAVPVDARVIESRVAENDLGDHRPVVRYRYEYDGREYVGDRVFEDGTGSVPAAEAERIVDRYPEGASVTAYVDADRPAEARLVTGPTSPLYRLFVGVGVAAALLGVVSLGNRLFRFHGG